MQHARRVNCPWRSFSEFRIWAEERGYNPKAGDQVDLRTSKVYGFAPRIRKRGQADDRFEISRQFFDAIVDEDVRIEAEKRIRINWTRMMDRVYKKADPLWEQIGGAGIQVCGDWHGFNAFSAWAMEHGGDRVGSELLRRDRGQDFCPGNCVWN
jgi:hypothetical protein